ncbi:MAG TPA: hypothetical protein VEZ40_10195 [Pyrinomonadaceae bacterium]|nr:hypothetical protein [Pyrinomonadaceae bacterium]
MEHGQKRRRRWGIVAASVLALVALVPQLQMWRALGSLSAWHGSHLSFFFDEAAYAAYINALIDGRPRLSDPYTGRDDAPGAPQPESLFSIQFVPAYAVALPARLFGISASTAFIVLSCFAAFASALALYQLLSAILDDDALAATGMLAVLCFPSLAQKIVRTLRGLETAYLPLPFLRRYLPAAPMPLFFLFFWLVWRALKVEDRRAANASAVGAGVIFALLVFSYFYLWTAALAWLACLAFLWLAARPPGWQRALSVFAILGAIALAALVPYFYLLSHRAPSMDAAQALALSRRPELFRATELVSALALVLLAFGAWRGYVNLRARAVLFAASFALMPFVVFNKQLITGRSLQPVHYEQFIANYVAFVALALSVALVWSGRAAAVSRDAGRIACVPRKILASVALVALGWAAFEVFVATRGAAGINVRSDEARPVYLRLSEMARAEGELEPGTGRRRVVFSPDIAQADRLPGVAPQAVLWSPHMSVFSGVTLAEEKERLYQQLYYSNIDAARFADFISRPHPYRTAVFGSARVLNGLDATRAPVTPADLDAEARAYAAYLSSFTRERAARTPLSYVVVAAAEGQTDLGNIDRWYARDAGERVGNHTIYRVKLRPQETTKAER